MHKKLHASVPTFSRPHTPAAVCMHIIRLRQPVSRGILKELSGKSQPTVTRAVNALIEHGLVQERADLAVAKRPGRPTVPVQLGNSPWAQVGIALGTNSTYIGAYNTRGQVLREKFVEVAPIQMTPLDFINVLEPHVRSLVEGTGLPLANLGISSSGTVDAEGIITAPNLGWSQVDIAQLLRAKFEVPISVASVISAIAGAEQQLQSPEHEHTVLLFYVDDTVGAAVLTPDGVRPLTLNQNTARVSLGPAALYLANKTNPKIIVLAGSGFGQPDEARAVAAAIRSSQRTKDIEIRVIPTHLDNARAAARAVALDRLIHFPLELAQSMIDQD